MVNNKHLFHLICWYTSVVEIQEIPKIVDLINQNTQSIFYNIFQKFLKLCWNEFYNVRTNCDISDMKYRKIYQSHTSLDIFG